MDEAFLNYVWKYRLLKSTLFTTDGLELIVHSPGEVNTDSGPDFFNSDIQIGNIRWVGNVEIHTKASDWYLHKHHLDKAYNNVVLHVVYENDKDVLLENGNKLHVLEVKSFIRDGVLERGLNLLHSSQSGIISCIKSLENIQSFYFSTYFEKLVVERLERKSGVVDSVLSQCAGSWESCCYIMFAKYFGGKTNSLPFEMLAKSIPIQLYSKLQTSEFQIEALLFGQSGLLEIEYSDNYPCELKKEYDYLKKVYNLTPIDGSMWKFFRIRPNGFPTLRISQFAMLLKESRNLFSKLLEAKTPDELMAYFDVSTSDYWTTHYHFDKESVKSEKRIGRSFANMLIINAWIPLLFHYGAKHGMQSCKDLALQLLEKADVESNATIKTWCSAGLKPKTAFESQALLELHEEYCKTKRCLECNIGYKVLKG